MSTWDTLLPDDAMVHALDQADNPTSREAIRNELIRLVSSGVTNLSPLQRMRKRWSEQFARACATMVANGLRAMPDIDSGYHITPDASGGNQEFFAPLGHKKGKRIDVVVSRELLGLQIGVSLKGLNFRDGGGGNFDKNLTGRLYELRDEVSTVHDYLPRAFMAGLFFVPAAGCFDKVVGPSSFANTVAQLRSRSGRLDPSVPAQNWKCDFAAVGLYGSGEPVEVQNGLPRGVVRYFALADADGIPTRPPRRGLPTLSSTLTLDELLRLLVSQALRGTAAGTSYAEAADETIVLPAVDASAPGVEVGDDAPDDDPLDPTS